MSYTVGCDAEGRLTAAKIGILGDLVGDASVGGKVLNAPPATPAGPTGCRRSRSRRSPPTPTTRRAAPCAGFGVNQTSFAIEGCLDLLAARVGLDGWEMRRRNIVRLGDLTTTGQTLEQPVGAEKTLLAVKPAWDAARAQGRAAGIAAG